MILRNPGFNISIYADVCDSRRLTHAPAEHGRAGNEAHSIHWRYTRARIPTQLKQWKALVFGHCILAAVSRVGGYRRVQAKSVGLYLRANTDTRYKFRKVTTRTNGLHFRNETQLRRTKSLVLRSKMGQLGGVPKYDRFPVT